MVKVVAPRVIAVAVTEPEGKARGGRSVREYERVAGPFDGYRVGRFESPVRIYDLSRGGCFINSTHEHQLGSTLVLKIDLPEEGQITVKAETVYCRPGFGVGVRFVDVDAETGARLIRTVDELKER